MTIPYLGGYSWKDLTREERFYCFVLYSHAVKSPNRFARWVSNTAKLDLDSRCNWDLGVEVCLYRDVLWHRGPNLHPSSLPAESVKPSRLSPKRTFDLCLFGTRQLVIIEAKVFEAFTSKQTRDFSTDKDRIKELFPSANLEVLLVPLASSQYYSNLEKYGSVDVLRPFKGRLTWYEAYWEYRDPLLRQAEQLYGSKIRKLERTTVRQLRDEGLRAAEARSGASQ